MVVPTATVIHGAGNELLAAALAWLNPRFLSEFYPTGTSHFKCALNPGVACELADRGGSISRALRQTLLHRRFSSNPESCERRLHRQSLY
jgi:hypothetical protein